MQQRMSVLSVLVAILLAAGSRADVSPQDGAGVVLAATSLVGLAAELTTHSGIEVEIEVFRQPDGEPFTMDHPTALQAIVNSGVAPSSILLNTRRELMPYMQDISTQSTILSDVIAQLTPLSADSGVSQIIARLNGQITAAQSVVSAWTAFTAACDGIGMDTSLGSGAQATAQSALDRLRGPLQDLGNYPTLPASALSVDILALVEFSVTSSIRSLAIADQSLLAQAIAAFNATAAAADNTSSCTDQAAILNRALQDAINVLTPAHAATVSSANLGSELARLTAALCLSSGTAAASAAEKQKQAGNSAYQIVMRAFLGGVNLGPISNELIQGILAQSGAIDKITDPTYDKQWQQFGLAKSKGNTGDHNAIIYMEDFATPVLKTAQFDPSAFIAANGMMFQKAFTASSNLFGLPKPGDTSGDLNLFDLKKKKRQAQGQVKANQLALLDALRVVLTEHGNAAKDNGTVATALRSAATKLTSSTAK